MENKCFLFIFVLLFALNCRLIAQPGQPLFRCPGNIDDSQAFPNPSTGVCNNNISNFLTNHALELVPIHSVNKVKVNLNIIFVQNAAGIGNFQVNNPQHMAYYNAAIGTANAKLNNLQDNSSNSMSCICNSQPDFYNSAYIELVPHYIEIRSNYYFDHMNDPVVNNVGSIFNTSRPFLKEIVQLAKQQPDYGLGGINWVITNHGAAIIDLLNSPPGVGHWQIPSLSEPFSGYVVADRPSFDLSKDMIIHFPDGFLRFLGFANFYAPNNQWWIDGEWIPLIGQLLAHETLHFLDLGDIVGSTNCSENIMNNSSANSPAQKVNLTGCQLRNVFTALYLKTSRTSIVCEDAINSNIIVDQNEIWRNNIKILGDVVIKNGYTLTVTCEVHMSPKGKIIVERGGKLIVDGGLITGDCDDMWKGIIVEGDAPMLQSGSGIVELKNSSVIEHARTAISMNPTHLPWSKTYQNYFGGIVLAENSTIRKGYRGVEFMRYAHGGVKDMSNFKNVIFENLDEGVTNWANDGVTFDHCTFRGIAIRGIHPYDSEVIVKNGTSFEGMPIGVDIITTYPTIFSSKIGLLNTTSQPNEFNCTLYGIYAKSGGNIEPLSILRNNFIQGTAGFHQDGNGQFLVQDNNFANPGQGVRFYDCGSNNNFVITNIFNSNSIGANSNKNNIGLQYLGNCFQNNTNVGINNQNGNISSNQGNLNNAAGNCFDGNVVDINNRIGANSFSYFVLNGTPITSCKYPENANSYNYSVSVTSQNDIYEECMNNSAYSQYNYCGVPESATIADLVSARQRVQEELNLLTQHNTNPWALDYWTHEYEICTQGIDDLIGQKSFWVGPDNLIPDKEAAINYFNSHEDFMNKATAYGIMVSFGEYDRARAYLQALPAENIDEMNFKWIQGINLDYLQNRLEYDLKEENRLLIRQIGRSGGPLNGYARSLYEVLTGERIDVEFANLEGYESHQRNENAYEGEQMSIFAFPSPVQNGRLNITVSGGETRSVLQSTIFDSRGVQWISEFVTSDGASSLDVSSLPPGIYFFRVCDSRNEVLYQTKVVILD